MGSVVVPVFPWGRILRPSVPRLSSDREWSRVRPRRSDCQRRTGPVPHHDRGFKSYRLDRLSNTRG